MKAKIVSPFFLCTAMAFFILSCRPADKKIPEPVQKRSENSSLNREDRVVKQVMALPEIEQKNTEVEQSSKGQRHLSGYINSLPTSKDPYYWVDIAEDNGDSYVTYYTFAVDRRDFKIRYYDPVQDSLISLEEWRKNALVNEP